MTCEEDSRNAYRNFFELVSSSQGQSHELLIVSW